MYASSLRAFVRFPHALSLSVKKGPYLDVNREMCMADALSFGATHLMFIDSDVDFPADGVLRLLAHDKEIIGAKYNKKKEPTESTLILPIAMPRIPAEPFPASALGAGFLLIKLAPIVERMQPPFFWYGCRHTKVGAHDTASFVGEDTAFCARAREAGFTVWCDPTIDIGHWGDKRY